MSSEARLCRLIGEIDDRYVTEAIKVPKPKRNMLWVSIAATAACVVFMVAFVCMYVDSDRVVYPSALPMDVYDEYVSGQYGGQLAAKIYINYSQLKSRADLIVFADVEDVYCDNTAQGYAIYAKVRVFETLKGDALKDQIVYVQDNAGVNSENKTVSLYGDPLLEKGNRVLLFLYMPIDGIVAESGERVYAIFGSVGKFFYDKDGEYHWSMLYSERYVKESTVPLMLYDPRPKTLDEMKDILDQSIDVTQSAFASMSRPPLAGEVFCYPHFNNLLEELQEKHSQFLISIYVYDEVGFALSKEKTMQECIRLANLGYYIYQKPSTQPQSDNEIVGVFTINELNTLVLCEEYGYLFGDIWNSSDDMISQMDEELRVKQEVL